jgi:hypothetical protein
MARYFSLLTATCRSSGVRTAEGVEGSETKSAAASPNLGLA